MATWVRNGTGTAPSTTDANLIGTYELDNATAPGDFDPAAVNSVRIEYRITGASFVDDTWQNAARALLTLNGVGTTLATVDGNNQGGLGNEFTDIDETDNSPNNGQSTAEWEGAELNPPTDYATYNAEMMPDGGTLTMSVLVITIDYTPTSGQTIAVGVLAETDALVTIAVVQPSFVVEQVGWRWFEDGTGSLTALAAEDVKPTLPGDQNYKMVRARVELEETGGGADTNKIVAARMSGDDGTTWETMLLDTDSDADKHLLVGDGADTAGNTISSRLLANTDTSGKYHETQVLVESLAANESLEVDFSLRTRVVAPDKDYRFELLWDGTPVPIKSGAVKIELRGSTAATREAIVQPDLTDLTSGSSDTNGTSIATASIAPSANSLVIATIGTGKAAPPQNTPTLTGAGMTWVQVRDFLYDDAGVVRRLTQFRALDSSPGSGALTFDFGGQTQDSFVWTVVEFDNVDTSGTNGSGAVVQEAQFPATVGSHTGTTVVLSAFSGNRNVTYGVAAKEVPTDADMVGDLPAMIVINEEADGENDQRMIDQWRQGELLSVVWSWAVSRRRVGFAMEVKASDATGVTNTIGHLEEPASGDPNTMAGGHGQRGFYDGTNWWSFYMEDESTNSIQYKHTSNLANGWLPATPASLAFTAVANPEDFNIIFREIGGTKYVMVVVENSNTHRYFKRGTISGTTITWDSTEREVTTVDSSNNGPPGVVLDDGDFVWFGGKGGTVGQELWAQRSVNTFDNATYYTFNTVKTVSESGIEGAGWDPPELVGLASSEVLIVYPDATNVDLRARKCTESGGMGSPVTINVSTDSNVFEWNARRASDGNVYCVYGDDDTNSWDWALRVYSISGDSWTTGTSPNVTHGGTANDGFLCYWGADDRLYVFDTIGDRSSRDTRIQYKSYSGGTSGTWDDSLRYITPSLVGNADHWSLILDEDGSTALMVTERGDDALIGTHYILEYYVLNTPGAEQTIAVGVLAETNSLIPIPAVKPIITAVGVLAEAEVLLPAVVVQPGGQTIAVTALATTDTLLPVSPEKIANIGTLPEIDTLISAAPVKPIFVQIGTISEANNYYLELPDPDITPDQRASTPSHASLDITEDIELIAYSNVQIGENMVLIDKLDPGVPDDGYAFWIDDNNSPLMRWGDGTTLHSIAGDVGWPNLTRQWGRATLVVDNGSTEHVVTFYRSTDPGDSPIGGINWTLWSQHTISGVTDIQANTLTLKVGMNISGGTGGEGKHYRAVVRDGIGGTVVADFNGNDFFINDSDTDTGVDSTGKTWTINGTSAFIRGAGLQPLRPVKVPSIGTLAESNTLLPVAPEKFAPIGTLAELDSLIAAVPFKTATIGTLAELESLIAVDGIKTADIGTLAELDSLIAVAADTVQVIAVTTLAETDSLIVVQPIKVAPIGTIAESDVLISIAAVKPIITSVGTLAEVDVLNAIQAIKVAPIGTLAEVESLLSVVGLKTADIGTIAEIESLIAVQALKVAPIGVMTETDTLVSIDPVKPIITAVGIMIETDSLISVQAVHVASIGTLAEVDTLVSVQGIKIVQLGTLAEADSLIPIATVTTQVISVATLAELDTLIAVTGLKTVDIGTLAEIESLIAVQALKVVVIGTLAETDVLIPVAPVKPIITTVGTLTELESLIAVTGLKIADIGTIAEIESLIAVQGIKVVQVGTLVEADSLVPIEVVATQVVPVATLAELDALIAIAGLKTIGVGTLAEVESLLAIGALKVANIGTITEVDALIGVAALKPIIQVVGVLAEIESLLPIGPLKIALIGTLAEIESLIGIAGIKTVDIGTITESDVLIPVTAGVAQTIAVSTLAELDALIAVAGIKTVDVGTLAEIETLIAAGVSIFKTIGTLAELDLLLPIAGLKLATVGTLAEVESLLAIQGLKIADIGTLAELDTLIAARAGATFDVGTLGEADSLIPVQPFKVANIGTLAEVETLLSILAVKPIITAVGTLAELDALIAANPLKDVQIGTLAEVDSLISIDALKVANVGTINEVNNLLGIAGFKTVDVGTMAELETLLSVSAEKTVPVGTLLETNGLIPIQALKPIVQTIGTLAETDTLVGIIVILGVPVIFVMNVGTKQKDTTHTSAQYDATQTATVEGT